MTTPSTRFLLLFWRVVRPQVEFRRLGAFSFSLHGKNFAVGPTCNATCTPACDL
jgi:hypothetical protein